MQPASVCWMFQSSTALEVAGVQQLLIFFLVPHIQKDLDDMRCVLLSGSSRVCIDGGWTNPTRTCMQAPGQPTRPMIQEHVALYYVCLLCASATYLSTRVA